MFFDLRGKKKGKNPFFIVLLVLAGTEPLKLFTLV